MGPGKEVTASEVDHTTNVRVFSKHKLEGDIWDKMAIGPSRLLGRFQLYLIVCIICIVLYASSECEMHYPLSMRCITL